MISPCCDHAVNSYWGKHILALASDSHHTRKIWCLHTMQVLFLFKSSVKLILILWFEDQLLPY